MGGILGGFLGTVVVGTTVFTINLFFMGIASVLRLMPLLLPIIGRVLWGVLVYSCRLYYLLLNRVAPLIEQYTKIKILEGLWRLGTTLGMSLLLGLVILFVSHIALTFWSMIPFVIHGLFVDFTWDEIPDLDTLEMGTRL